MCSLMYTCNVYMYTCLYIYIYTHIQTYLAARPERVSVVSIIIIIIIIIVISSSSSSIISVLLLVTHTKCLWLLAVILSLVSARAGARAFYRTPNMYRRWNRTFK